MRLKLLLQNTGFQSLTANYYYPLSAAVYKLLRFGSPEFSEFLHDIGYKLNGKKYKLFTFALILERFKFNNASIILLSPNVQLLISSPLIDELIQNFVIGTFESQKIEIVSPGQKTIFEIKQVESLPDIIFSQEMQLRLLSPIVLSTKKEINGKLMPYYFRYNDDIEEINRIFNINLNNKYELISGINSNGKKVWFDWDSNYIKTHEAKGKRFTKKQTIKEGTPEETDIIGNLIPFKIKGDVDLIRTGYECGFGEKNSLGFGCAEVL